MSGADVPPGAAGEVPAEATAAPAARVPGLAWRIGVGAVLLVVLILVAAVLPYEVLRRLGDIGVTSGAAPYELLLAGVGLAVLATARYVAKPTRAYGPLATLTAAAGIAYLLWLAGRASFTIAPAADVGVVLTYGMILELLAIAPALSLIAALVTTYEDLRHPGERLPYDYPAGR